MYLLAVVAVVGAGVLILGRRFDQRTKALKESRRGENLQNFADAFSGEGIPTRVVEAVYRWVQEWQGDSAFPVQSTDRLSNTYGIVDDDVFDMIRELCGQLNRRTPSGADVQSLAKNVYTIGDLVRGLSDIPEA